jgi:hypothetical protein
MTGVIARLSQKVVQESTSPSWRDAAGATGGVPVYEDMGGILLVAADGETLFYDTEAKTIHPVTDKWRIVALVRASRLYSELADLAPAKPEGARACGVCGGTGITYANAICGECWSAGWVS